MASDPTNKEPPRGSRTDSGENRGTATAPQMTSDQVEERVREEACILWNADGRPDGKTPDDYLAAARMVIDHQDRLTDRADRRGDL